MIIGGAGSGKSTLARRLGDVLGLPVYHIDREVYWLPGWVERDKASQSTQVARIAAQDAWVFEGNSARTFALREARAELVLLLDWPIALRLFRVIRRTVAQRGQSRADMADGCPERIHKLPGFLWFILSTARAGRDKQAAFFAATTFPKQRFTSVHDVNSYLESMT